MAELHRVWGGDIGAAWERGAGHFLAKAVAQNQGEFTLEDVRKQIDDGKWFLWVAEEEGYIVGALTARVVYYPQMVACEVIHFASSLPRDEWVPLLTGPLEEWAKFVGCTHMMFYGRAGFERVKPTEGYEKWYVCMGKTLSA